MAEGASDGLPRCAWRATKDYGVGVMATGHGVAAPCDGGVLINNLRA